MAVLDVEGSTPLSIAPVRRRRRAGDALFVCAVGWIVLIGLAAALAGVLPIVSPTDMDMLGRRAPPSAEHLLGTDSSAATSFPSDPRRAHLAHRRAAARR